MTLSFRKQKILEAARESGAVEVEDLATRFDVTVQTIRRDLGELCDEKLLRRVHGGAVLDSSVQNVGYQARRHMLGAEKESIGALCAAHIPAGSSLFVNIGTTTEAVARHLTSHAGLRVITNNLNVANTLSNAVTDAELIVAGGALRRSDGGIVGEAATAFIRQFKVDIAVIGVSAIDEDGALLDYDYREVAVARAIIENSRRVFLVADRSKFNRTASVRIASMRDLDVFVTDAEPPAAIRSLCDRHEVQILVANPGR